MDDEELPKFLSGIPDLPNWVEKLYELAKEAPAPTLVPTAAPAPAPTVPPTAAPAPADDDDEAAAWARKYRWTEDDALPNPK